MVIDDDDIDARIVRHVQRLIRHGAAIDGDDKAAALLAEPDQRLSRRAVSFEQAIGDVMVRIGAEHP